ncbi:hypothetical protein P154DRAFT_443552 [Amniculicola lignicola CBS 123094]|uniref:Zn(2)-C6 fungal-type domain-containing protein n=1 Tax=Amniculicola lignicola CBS 123094 TaxID=1392246 RepID=A0A6A5W3J0_9PLEO|nr:hypothetical protein P154DRAFT_443552 [Amniculicola lignicola CBS 123094]
MHKLCHATTIPQQRVGRKSKVKTGCRTCKIRKVKCDEHRPACQRCVSTGRICDGYGIWGGGGNGYANRLKPSIPHQFPSGKALNTEERHHFDWFRLRTSVKLPGIFISAFWDTLVFQASADEPAVLHAVIALSSAHRLLPETCRVQGIRSGSDEKERFFLRQYTKAINLLQPHFERRDTASMRIIFIVCVLFVCLEYLRGDYSTGYAHLQSGLKLLEQCQDKVPRRGGFRLLRASSDTVDDCIADTFAKLFVQAELFGQSPDSSYPAQPHRPMLPSNVLSPDLQRQRLDELLHLIVRLTSHRKFATAAGHCVPSDDNQQRVEAGLSAWFKAYRVSKVDHLSQTNPREAFANRILHIYHVMADIEASTLFRSGGEMIYDSQLHKFVSIISQCMSAHRASKATSDAVFGLEEDSEMSHSIADMGWIAPLYYTAVKCRNHRVRLQAIRLIESDVHKEGIWDAELATSVAREVMRMEEGDFYEHTCIVLDDDFPIDQVPGETDLAFPILPETSRLHDVRVELPNFNARNIKLIGRTSGQNIEILREYDVASGQWVKGSVGT